MSAFDGEMMGHAFDHAWGGFERIEFGDPTTWSGEVNESDTIGNVDLFTAVANATPLERAPVIPDPADPDCEPLASGAEKPVESVGDGYRMITQESIAVHVPIPVEHLITEGGAPDDIAIAGLKRAVRLMRFATDVQTQSLADPEERIHLVQTTDVLQVVDMRMQPPTLLATYPRPEVASTLSADDQDVTEREFTDPTQPTYEHLLELKQTQTRYRSWLRLACSAQGVEI